MLKKAYAPKNLAKGSWTEMPDDEIDLRLLDEIKELQDAVFRANSADILQEAADVLAFASMRADPDRTLKQYLKTHPFPPGALS
jgi:hypothetical protein